MGAISRRDFVNGALVGAGASLLSACAPADRIERPSRPVPPPGSPSDDWYGFGGVGDYAASHGNTPGAVFEAHRIRHGRFDAVQPDWIDTGEVFDTAVVGAGLAGLGAAYEFATTMPESARCLILDDHPVFGGESKQNEFEVNGCRLTAPQGSNGFSIPPDNTRDDLAMRRETPTITTGSGSPGSSTTVPRRAAPSRFASATTTTASCTGCRTASTSASFLKAAAGRGMCATPGMVRCAISRYRPGYAGRCSSGPGHARARIRGKVWKPGSIRCLANSTWRAYSGSIRPSRPMSTRSSPPASARAATRLRPTSCMPPGCPGSSVAPAIRRTQPDAALRKLAETGGVFGVVSFPGTLVNADRCTVADYAANIEIAVNLMGIEHVGFAMDHVTGASLQEILTAPEWPRQAAKDVGVTFWPRSDGHLGLENHTGYPNLTRALVARGYKDDDIRKIMGGNWIRLIRDTIG